jgi:uncharacterized membrane protein YdbT with pleckstrin-like domain
MGYVEDHLLPNEELRYRAHLHKLIFVWPVILLLLGVGIVIGLWTTGVMLQAGPLGVPLSVLPVLVAGIPLLGAYITYTSSEFAVTDKRVIIKVGWLRRKTLELMLGKVEGIGVDQTVIGRMLDSGTITVTGTGGSDERFLNIAAPLEFRRQVQAQISAAESARGGHVAAPHAGSAREERDCPYCAERILARARVCKHCGRDVTPVGST